MNTLACVTPGTFGYRVAAKPALVKARNYITHEISFDRIKDEFESWLNPANGVIKAMVKIN